ncbi:MAG: hypothetical protein HFH53_05655 [Hespellia sp.]|nr:hypothetical protein [Hespellia sp.]
MKLEWNTAMRNNRVFNYYQMNRTIANKQEANGIKKQEERRDSLMLSSFGKTGNLIDTLMRQKMEITDRKNSLLGSVGKDGRTMKSIQSQLDAYEEQIKTLDQQITEAMTKEMEKQLEKSDEKKATEEKTKEELQEERLTDVVNISGDIERVKAVDAAKKDVDREADVLRSEIELDRSREVDVRDKEKKLAGLEAKSLKLDTDRGVEMVSIHKEIKEEDEKKPEKKEDDEKAKDVEGNIGEIAE